MTQLRNGSMEYKFHEFLARLYFSSELKINTMKKELFEKNPLLKLSFDFSLMVIDYCELLEANKKFIVARQLLKSGTSIGANAMEAQNAESKADFVHKMKIAGKEAEETQYWLWLCDYAPTYPNCEQLINKVEEVNKILGKILHTSKQNSISNNGRK